MKPSKQKPTEQQIVHIPGKPTIEEPVTTPTTVQYPISNAEPVPEAKAYGKSEAVRNALAELKERIQPGKAGRKAAKALVREHLKPQGFDITEEDQIVHNEVTKFMRSHGLLEVATRGITHGLSAIPNAATAEGGVKDWEALRDRLYKILKDEDLFDALQMIQADVASNLKSLESEVRESKLQKLQEEEERALALLADLKRKRARLEGGS